MSHSEGEEPMTPSKRNALRKSILLGVKAVVHSTLIGSDYDVKEVWCDENREWNGPEVEKDCELVWRDFMAWLKKEGAAIQVVKPKLHKTSGRSDRPCK